MNEQQSYMQGSAVYGTHHYRSEEKIGECMVLVIAGRSREQTDSYSKLA